MTGNIGYIKAKDISDRETKRVNMQKMDFLAATPDLDNAIKLNKETITQDAISTFSKRREVIEKIINDIITKEKFTVIMDLENADLEAKKLERFEIELMPRLREIGGCLHYTNK